MWKLKWKKESDLLFLISIHSGKASSTKASPRLFQTTLLTKNLYCNQWNPITNKTMFASKPPNYINSKYVYEHNCRSWKIGCVNIFICCSRSFESEPKDFFVFWRSCRKFNVILLMHKVYKKGVLKAKRKKRSKKPIQMKESRDSSPLRLEANIKVR